MPNFIISVDPAHAWGSTRSGTPDLTGIDVCLNANEYALLNFIGKRGTLLESGGFVCSAAEMDALCIEWLKLREPDTGKRMDRVGNGSFTVLTIDRDQFRYNNWDTSGLSDEEFAGLADEFSREVCRGLLDDGWEDCIDEVAQMYKLPPVSQTDGKAA